MPRLLALTTLVLLACGCGRNSKPEANTTYFWLVKSSTMDIGQCSDDPDFRKNFTPIAVGTNTYFTYKVDKTGKKATVQSCAALDTSTCTDQTPPIVFDITGNELDWNGESKSALGTTGCNALQSQSWTFTDKVSTFTLASTSSYTLVDNQTACDRVEANLKAASPNGLGIVGCSVTWTLAGELR